MSFMSVFKKAFNGLQNFNLFNPFQSWLGKGIGKLLKNYSPIQASDFDAIKNNMLTRETLTGAEREANQWTADREDTYHQRTVSDMQAAGLNPALMYGSSAGGAQPSSSVSPSAPSGLGDLIALMRMPLEMQMASAQSAALEAQANKNNADANATNAKTPVEIRLLEGKISEIPTLNEMREGIKKLNDVQLQSALKEYSWMDEVHQKEMRQMDSLYREIESRADKNMADIKQIESNLRLDDQRYELLVAQTGLTKGQLQRIVALLPHEINLMDANAANAFMHSIEARRASILASKYYRLAAQDQEWRHEHGDAELGIKERPDNFIEGLWAVSQVISEDIDNDVISNVDPAAAAASGKMPAPSPNDFHYNGLHR